VLVDANLLIYAVDEDSPHHEAAASWLSGVLNGNRRIALPWQTIGAFVRIVTHPRAVSSPLSGPDAWGHVAAWLAAEVAWVPPTSEQTAAVFGELIGRYHITGNLVTDAQLAALAFEHGLSVMSADSDFARFKEVHWVNPLT
jgi:toxin-antitoxin system PIN domain toxin